MTGRIAARDSLAPIATTIIVSGTLTLDTIEREDAIHRDVPGGSALYAAASASLIVPTRVVGTVGHDFPTDALGDLWKRADRSAIEVLDGATFRWHVRYRAFQDGGEDRVTLARDPGVSSQRVPPTVSPLAEQHAVLLASTDPRIQAQVRGAYRQASLVGLDSMRHWWDTHALSLRALLPTVDIVFLDEGELGVVSDAIDLTSRVRQLHELGPSIVVIKRGALGAEVHRRGEEPLHAGAIAVTSAVDPTGAGDAFAGAFVAAGARSPERGDAYALRVASAAASFAVQAIGASALIAVEPAALERRMMEVEISAG